MGDDPIAGRPVGRSATLKDVAALAQVSIPTASKALRGGYRVSPETQARVKRAADLLRFAPNQLARGLLSNRSGTVGMITSDLEGRFSLPMLMGAEDASGSEHVSVFLCDARGDPIREEHHLRALLSRQIDGLIVVGDSTNPRLSLGSDFPVPVVYAYAPSEDPSDISVVSDDRGGGRQAVEYLLSCGRRRLVYIGGSESFLATSDRVAGATSALDDSGLAWAAPPVYGEWSEEWGARGVRALTSRGVEFDGVLCGNDVIARGVLDELRLEDVAVPADVSIVGHDNWTIIAAQARPQLTTIDLQLQAIGRRAAELLIAAIDGRPAPGRHVIPTSLIVRGSTAPYRT